MTAIVLEHSMPHSGPGHSVPRFRGAPLAVGPAAALLAVLWGTHQISKSAFAEESLALPVERAQHWSFRPVLEPAEPEVDHSGWVKTAVDRFILAKLEKAGMSPAPAADKRTLLRRATFDLTGLPPTPEETRTYLADESPDAFAAVVERLLASPQYGERWGRHWLDLVRYADTAGETADFPVPHAWRYRNWVIDAFNRDKPYDRFLTEQIAGDILAARLPPNAPRE